MITIQSVNKHPQPVSSLLWRWASPSISSLRRSMAGIFRWVIKIAPLVTHSVERNNDNKQTHGSRGLFVRLSCQFHKLLLKTDMTVVGMKTSLECFLKCTKDETKDEALEILCYTEKYCWINRTNVCFAIFFLHGKDVSAKLFFSPCGVSLW